MNAKEKSGNYARKNQAIANRKQKGLCHPVQRANTFGAYLKKTAPKPKRKG